jgi:hypothetical protein
MPFVGRVTNSVKLSLAAQPKQVAENFCFYRRLRAINSQQSRIENRGSMIAIFHPLSSILNHFDTSFSAPCQSVAGPPHQRTNAHDAKKQLVDGNFVGGSDLAKRAREQQVEEKPAEAGKSEKAEQTIAEKRRQP